MTRKERDELIERLDRRFSGKEAHMSSNGQHLTDALDRMVHAGASRFGVRVGEQEVSGFRACDLAPALARMIDHTALKPETTERQIRELCMEALQYCFASVCVNPCYVRLVAELLSGSEVAVCTVVGFPLGATASATKALETRIAIEDGATEIDMVLNVGMLKSGRYEFVENDIRAVVEACRETGQSLGANILSKVILETALLTDEEKVIASVLTHTAHASFVKTSTGFSTGGATVADIALMRRVVGPDMGIKASGGVRTREDAEAMIAHGATRIGASASVAIIKELANA